MDQKFLCNSEEELGPIAEQLLNSHTGKVFAFYGEMGSGKTTFIKSLCAYLKVTDTVSSPTFSIINVYLTQPGDEVYHFDFYRLKNITEAYDIGYEDYLYSGNYCFLEWPEKVESILGEEVIPVKITVDRESKQRIIQF